jgi:dephospho-CoA kinase
MVIGITGGIGCGKSTASKLLSEMFNAPIIDADKISHEAFSSKEILLEMCNFLGNDILDENGNIDKAKVANIVFLDIAKLKKLNSIIHPYVMKKIRDTVKSLSKEYAYIIVDVPLPNDDFINLSDFIITIWADLDVRIERLQKRSNFTKDAIMARIKKQMSQEEYEALANTIIYNNGTTDELKNKLVELKPKLINYKKILLN